MDKKKLKFTAFFNAFQLLAKYGILASRILIRTIMHVKSKIPTYNQISNLDSQFNNDQYKLMCEKAINFYNAYKTRTNFEQKLHNKKHNKKIKYIDINNIDKVKQTIQNDTDRIENKEDSMRNKNYAHIAQHIEVDAIMKHELRNEIKESKELKDRIYADKSDKSNIQNILNFHNIKKSIDSKYMKLTRMIIVIILMQIFNYSRNIIVLLDELYSLIMN